MITVRETFPIEWNGGEMNFINRRNRQNTEISMLNLIDVIFMLLIFFMIATSFNNYMQFQMSVPKSDVTLTGRNKEGIEVIIDRERNYYLRLGDSVRKVTPENIQEEIRKYEEKYLENILLTADENLEYRIIMEIMLKLKDRGVKNINLNIQKNNK